MHREVLKVFIVGSTLLWVGARPLRGEKIWSSEVVSANEIVVRWNGTHWGEERALYAQEFDEEIVPTSWLIVPPGVIPQVEVEKWEGEEWDWGEVQDLFSSSPLSEIYSPERAPQGEPELLFPTQSIVVGASLSFRGYYLAPIAVQPISYDPQRRKLKVAERIEARIWLPEDPHPHQRPIDPPGSDVSRFIDQITLNPPLRDPAGQIEHLGRILILYGQNLPQQAQVWIDSLAVWKRQLGYRVDLLSADPQGDMVALRSSIRRNYWQVEDPISYLILIGSNQPQDAIYWPFFRQGAYEGDHFWGLMQDTNRFVPDVAVGRMLATSITELQGVIKRSLLYEREPYLDDPSQGGWVRRGVYTAENIAVQGGQFVPSMVHLGRWIYTRLRTLGYAPIDTLYASDDASMRRIEGTIRDLLENQGVGLLISRGWLTGCIIDRERGRTAYTGRRHPFTAAITCLSFETQKLFFQVTTVNRPTGPIGAVAIAGLTNTKYNNSFLGGMIRGLLNFGLTQPGWLMTFGKAQVRGDYRLSPELDEDVLRVLATSLLMGDPSLRLLLPGMRSVEVHYPQTLSPSSTGFEVQVTDPEGNPIEGGIVSLTQGGGVHLVSLTDRRGRAYFSFPPQSLEEGRAILTVWGDRIVTQVLGVSVQASPVELEITEVTFDNPDGRFSAGESLSGVLVVTNNGERSSEEGTVRLTSSHYALSFDQNELRLPAIDAGERAELEFGIHISRRSRFGEEVRVGIELISGAQIFPHALNFSISRPQPALTLLNFTQGEGLVRDSWAEFRPLIANWGDETLPNGRVELFSLRRGWVEVVRGTLNIPPLEPHRSAYPDGSFRVRLSPQAIPGNKVPLLMVITAGEEPDIYEDTLFLDDLIRPLGSDQPVGPDEYGYIAFDSYDVTWDKRPVFSWREINPLIEGYEFEGVRLPLEDNGNNQDTSVVVELPFTFRYYGREFNRLVVCSNGWVAFGDENAMFIDFRNYPIPGVQGPDAQLAILWDDLVNYGGRQSGGVFIYHIEEEGVFVVEWSGLEVYSDPLHREQSFQIILYDPERWLTRTGDGEIKFQYLKASPVRGDVTDNYYATIGIKNLDNTGGIQYAYWDRYHPNAAPLGDSLAILFTTEEALQVGSLWGKVTLLADTSLPVEGARIVLSTGAETRSDPRGEFRLERVPYGSHSLLVTSPGLADERINFSIRAGEETRLYIRMGRPVIEVPRREVVLSLAPGDNNSLQTLTVRNRGDGTLRFRMRQRYPDGGELRYPLRMNADLSGEIGDGLLAGLEMVGDRFFISGSGSLESNEDNTIYVLNREGREVRRFSQRSQDIFGFRDLAWGRNALWGGDRVGSNLYVVALDTSGEFVQRYLLSEIGLLPDDPSEAYALTWNEDGTRLFIGYGDKDIVELGWSGDTLRVVRRFRMALPGLTLDLRGLAWNVGDEDDMPLYGLSQSSPDNQRALLVKCNPYRGGTRLVRQLALNHTENGTGLAIGYDWSVTRATLGYVADDRRSDSLRVFEIGPDARFLRYDIGWQEVMPGQDFPFPLHFSSRNLRNNQTYSLGLWIEHNSSQEPVMAVCSLRVDSSAWVGDTPPPIPHHLAIEGFYPQPFNAQATIIFMMPVASRVALNLYDLQGRMVKRLLQEELPAGRHRWLLDAQDLPAGLYLLRLESPQGKVSRKVLLIR